MFFPIGYKLYFNKMRNKIITLSNQFKNLIEKVETETKSEKNKQKTKHSEIHNKYNLDIVQMDELISSYLTC